jgi:hypothetical protein
VFVFSDASRVNHFVKQRDLCFRREFFEFLVDPYAWRYPKP